MEEILCSYSILTTKLTPVRYSNIVVFAHYYTGIVMVAGIKSQLHLSGIGVLLWQGLVENGI